MKPNLKAYFLIALWTWGYATLSTADEVITGEILTTAGPLKIELYPNKAPSLVANFVELVEKRFYQNTYVYDQVEGLALMMGSSAADGSRQVPHTVDDEFGKGLSFATAGMIAYSNTGPDMNSSNFLINLKPTPHFQDRYPIFGKVISTPEELHKIAEAYNPKNKTLKIKSITLDLKSYKKTVFKKRTPFSTDDIKELTLPKATELFTLLFKNEKLGKLTITELMYKSVRGRRVQVAYEAQTDQNHSAKLILLGTLRDEGLEIHQFQYQQVKSLISKDK